MHLPLRHSILSLAFALLFCLSQSAFAKKFSVQVGPSGNNFSPQFLTVELGDEVEWEWYSSFHSSTSGTPNDPSGDWNSGVLNSGSKYSYTFNELGSFPY
jgi:plastocyanin